MSPFLSRPLSPRLRETLDLLLKGKIEKEIAQDLGLEPVSVHKYITLLYRRYGVSGRAELMALFLNWLGLDFPQSMYQSE